LHQTCKTGWFCGEFALAPTSDDGVDGVQGVERY
jgi:hypothetical protein